MNKIIDFKNLSKPLKAIIILSLFFTSLTVLEFVLQEIEAESLSKSLNPGSNTITFRDITDGNVTQTISGDQRE